MPVFVVKIRKQWIHWGCLRSLPHSHCPIILRQMWDGNPLIWDCQPMQMLPPFPVLWIPILVSVSCAHQKAVVVKTDFGPLRGFVHQTDAHSAVNVFLGVPYAAAPVGPLRLEKPIPPHKWEEVRPAVEYPNACVPHSRPSNEEQVPPYSEDCLFLNIFAPQKEEAKNGTALRPVLVLVHGGAFEVGSSRGYVHTELGASFVRRGIVVVSVQYRLGVLGFASTGDSTMPGNLGLWDLLAALRWLRDQVRAFGGDGRRITVLGYGAGSAAVGALGMCPHSRDLFQQGVQMSGSILSQTGVLVANETRTLAAELHCPSEDSLRLKECLRAKSVDHIHDAVQKMGAARADVHFAKFSTRFDGHFFPRDFPELIHESPPKRTLLGFNRLEMLHKTLLKDRNDSVTPFAVPRERIADYGETDFRAFVRHVVARAEHFGEDGEEKAQKVQSEIVRFFGEEYDVPAEKDSKFWLERYTLVLTDLHYLMPAVWESRLKLNMGWPIHLYEFAYANPAVFPAHVPLHEAFHTYDHSLIFAPKDAVRSGQDRTVADQMVESIVNFVKKGNPSTDSVHWQMGTQEQPMRHLLVDGPTPKMLPILDLRRLKFWHTLTETHTEYNLIRGTHPRPGEHEEL